MINLYPASNQAAVFQWYKRTNWKHSQPLSPFGSIGRVARKLVATSKSLRPLISLWRLAAHLPELSDVFKEGPLTALDEQLPGHLGHLSTDGTTPLCI